jgi:surfactin synthase thioesterase subunit
MVCPVCITTALMANAPVLGASIGGLLAARLAHAQKQKQKDGQPMNHLSTLSTLKPAKARGFAELRDGSRGGDPDPSLTKKRK